MSYQRFVLPAPNVVPSTCPAVETTHAESVARLATVAGDQPRPEIRNERADHRFAPMPSATHATTATLCGGPAQTVAGLASVAGHSAQSDGDDDPGNQLHDWHCTPATFTNPATVSSRPGGQVATLIRPEAGSAHGGVAQPALKQADPLHCFVCEQSFTIDDAIVAVLTGTPDERLWLHHGCHDEHIRRCLAARQKMAAPAAGCPQ